MQDWWAFLAWYENVIVWPLAIGALLLLLTAKSLRRRVLFGFLLVLVFLPHIQKAVGDVYFDYLCRTQAGEFIYRTVDDVEGILQMRPRDGTKDYFDRMRVGDIPEDPYGHTNWEAQGIESMFVGLAGSGKYSFLEKLVDGAKQPSQTGGAGRYVVYRVRSASRDAYGQLLRIEEVSEVVAKPKSLYGFTWEEQTTVLASLFNIHEGVTKVIDLSSKEVLAERRGFLRVRSYAICPSDKTDDSTFRFVKRVLRPTQ